MICDCCGKEGAVIKHVTQSLGEGADILVVERVPMTMCPRCGESYFTAATLHELERLRLHRAHLKPRRRAPVIDFV